MSITATTATDKRTACESLINSFDAKNASVEAMQNYADCVNFLYTESITSGDIMGLIFIGAFIFSMHFGVKYGDILDYVIGFIFGFISTGLCALLIIGSMKLIMFMFGM